MLGVAPTVTLHQALRTSGIQECFKSNLPGYRPSPQSTRHAPMPASVCRNAPAAQKVPSSHGLTSCVCPSPNLTPTGRFARSRGLQTILFAAHRDGTYLPQITNCTRWLVSSLIRSCCWTGLPYSTASPKNESPFAQPGQGLRTMTLGTKGSAVHERQS